jgi:hypothetical protein
MSGFIQPQWSGFSGNDASSTTETDNARHKAERIAFAQRTARLPDAPTVGAQLDSGREAAPPLPFTPTSPRPHKALTP